MIVDDDQNLVLVDSTAAVDEINARFYGRFPFPWRPVRVDFLADPNFYTIMLSQDIGDWSHTSIPRSARIWVAGCGTNQAVFTALRFPNASVVGSDISIESLDVCSATAKQMGIANLELRRESINGAQYKEEFDYIICTGVIHHNADPKSALERIASALKPSGILELMVYNRYHRIITSAFQKAVRIIGGEADSPDFETELAIVRSLVEKFPTDNLIATFLRPYRGNPEPALADALLQPVEYSYTVETLGKLARDCGLELLHPCGNQSIRGPETHAWNLEFGDRDLRQRYEELPDERRWQITNLLLFESSPMLWFYLQREDAGRPRKTEKRICEEFLDTCFVRANTTQRSYVSNSDGNYALLPQAVPYPAVARDRLMRTIVDSADGRKPMKELFQQNGLPLTFAAVNRARIRLATSAFPYLIATPDKLDGATPGEPSSGTDYDERVESLEDLGRQRLKNITRKPIVGRR